MGTGHGGRTVRPCNQPELFLMKVQFTHGCVFFGGAAPATPLLGHPPRAWCLGRGPSWPGAWGQMGRLAVEAEQHLWVRSPTNK